MGNFFKKNPAVRFTILFILGIVFSRTLNPMTGLVLGAIVLLSGVVFVLNNYQQKKIIPIKNYLVFMLVVCMGMLIYSVNNRYVKELPTDRKFIRNAEVTGKVSAIDLKKKGRLVFYVNVYSLTTGDTAYTNPCEVLCSYSDTSQVLIDSLYATIKHGFVIRFKGNYSIGKQMRNPGEFDYSSYLREQGISGTVTMEKTHHIEVLSPDAEIIPTLLLSFRNGISRRIETLFDEDAAGLAKGLLLGDKNDIPYELQSKFVNAGVAHVLAVSGLNVAFVSLMIFLLLGRFSLHVRYIASAIGITVFWLIAGNSPPVVRAVLMGYIVIINYFTNRSSSGINTLFLTAFILLVFAPSDLFTASFQLSFGGVLALLIIYPMMKIFIYKLSIKNNLFKKLILFGAISFAAQIGILPITNYYFGKVSFTSLFANILVVPATTAVMGAEILTLIISIFIPPLAQLDANGCNFITKLIYKFVEFSGGESFSYIAITSFPGYAVLTYYILLAVFLYFFTKFISNKSKVVLIVSFLSSLVMFHVILNTSLFQPGKLNVLFVDVGQGDATLIQTPNGKVILIDAGNATGRFDNGKRVLLPLMNKLNISSIDYAILSHFDADHSRGLFSLLKEDKVKELILPPSFGSDEAKVILDLAAAKKIKITIPADSAWTIDNCKFYFMNNLPAWSTMEYSANDKSLCVKLEYGSSSTLLIGDAQSGRENLLDEYMKPFLKSDILKVAHHGSKYSSINKFLSDVSPEVSVISAGEGNMYHHPNKETLTRLEQAKTKVFRTDISGALLFRSDGIKFDAVNWK